MEEWRLEIADCRLQIEQQQVQEHPSLIFNVNLQSQSSIFNLQSSI
jgi:hypothetical protein